MTTALWIIATLAVWLALCWIVARFMSANGPDQDTDAQIDSIRAALESQTAPARQHIRSVK